MQKINKILNIVTIVMFVITVVLLGLFYFEVNFQIHNMLPRYTRNNYYGGHIYCLALLLLRR